MNNPKKVHLPRPMNVIGAALAVIFMVSLALGLTTHPAQAATFTINTTSDTIDDNPGDGICHDASGNCSLRAAIMEANHNGDTSNTINISGGPYTLSLGSGDDDLIDGAVEASGDLDVLKNLTITGTGNPVIQAGTTAGNGIDRVFDVDAPFGGNAVNFTISGLTIQFGKAAAPSGAGGDGGAVRFFGYNNTTPSLPGTLTIDGCTLTNNSTTAAFGGGIQVTTGHLVLTNSAITNNTATGGAGGGVYFDGGGFGTLSIDATSISANHATDATFGNGGGLYIVDSTAPSHLGETTSVSFDNNQAALDGGGIYQQGGVVTIDRVTGSGNTAGGDGSAVFAGGSVNATNLLDLTGNYFQSGGSFDGAASVINISGVLDVNGGSFSSTSGTLKITNGTFQLDSGGLFSHNSGLVLFEGTSNLTLSSSAAFHALTVDIGALLVETQPADNATVATLINSGTIRKTQTIGSTGLKTFGLTGASINVSTKGNLASFTIDRIDANIPHSAGTALQTGKYWDILRTLSGGAVEGVIDITLPNATAGSGDKVCRYTAGPSGGFDCGSDVENTIGAGMVTRLNYATGDWANPNPDMADWAVGSESGPTVLTVQSINASPAFHLYIFWAVVVLALLLGVILMVLFIRKSAG